MPFTLLSRFPSWHGLGFNSVEPTRRRWKRDRMAQFVSFLDLRQHGHKPRIDDRVSASSWDGKLHRSALKAWSHAGCRLARPSPALPFFVFIVSDNLAVWLIRRSTLRYAA